LEIADADRAVHDFPHGLCEFCIIESAQKGGFNQFRPEQG
jgi:hypothetical protein